MTFPAGETRTATAIVVLFVGPVQLAGGNASFRIARRLRAEVLCGKNMMIWKGLQIGHNDCPSAGLDKLRACMKGNLGFILAANCILDFFREVLADNRSWQEVRAGQTSKVDLVVPSGPTGMDPSQTVSMRTKMVGPGASEIVLYLATTLVDEASVFIASDTGVVALVSPAILSVVALDSPIEDLFFPKVDSTSDVPNDIALYFDERVVASTGGSKMIRITAGGMKVAIHSGQSDCVHVLVPGSMVSVDPPADLANESEVSVIVVEGAFLDMAGPETGLRFRPLLAKMCGLVGTDSALHNADADTDRIGSDDEWLAKAKQKGIRVRFQQDVLVCVVAQDDCEENNLVYVWSRSERMSRCS